MGWIEFEWLKSSRGVPKVLFCDNCSEFTSQAMDLWVYRNGVKIDFSRPGKPTDNAFVESFNGTFRSECHVVVTSHIDRFNPNNGLGPMVGHAVVDVFIGTVFFRHSAGLD